MTLYFWRLFALPNFRGPAFKSYTQVMTPASRHVVWKMFYEATATSPKVIVANTLIFQFSRSKVFGGHPSPFGSALWRLGQSLARIKFWGGSTPTGPKCSLPRKIHLGGSMLANKTFWLWTKVHRTFFLERGRNRCRSRFIQILDIRSSSGDIRDQSRKLSKMALNLDVFFRTAKF